MNKYLSISEAASLSKVSKSTIHRRLLSNNIVPRKVGNKYYLLKSNLAIIAIGSSYNLPWWKKRIDLVFQWHSSRNGKVKPEDISTNLKKKVWWLCPNGHEYKARVWSKMRSKHTTCIQCKYKAMVGKIYKPKLNKTVAKVRPHLIKEWDDKKNYPLTPYIVGSGSSKKVWWECKYGHSWMAIINNRVNGNSCPLCNKQIVQAGINSLIDTHPGIVKELWDFERNNKKKIYPENIASGNSTVKVYWRCVRNKDHKQWYSTPAKVVLANTGCSECSRKSGKIHYSDSLIVTHARLVKKEWDYKANNKKGIYPDKVSAGKHAKVAWKCNVADDHRWEASINKRALAGRGCPMCSNRIVVKSNCLGATHPELTKEWNYKENLHCTPKTVTAGSKDEVFWRCSFHKKHVLKTRVSQRGRKGSGCPYCYLWPESAQEINIRFELMSLFKKIASEAYQFSIKFKKRNLQADIFIPELDLVVEFDGSYWHRDSFKRDKEKTTLFKKAGLRVIRIRESPLKRVTKNDVESKANDSIKNIVDKVLNRILKMTICSQKDKKKVICYLKEKELRNQIQAKKYIKRRKLQMSKG